MAKKKEETVSDVQHEAGKVIADRETIHQQAREELLQKIAGLEARLSEKSKQYERAQLDVVVLQELRKTDHAAMERLAQSIRDAVYTTQARGARRAELDPAFQAVREFMHKGGDLRSKEWPALVQADCAREKTQDKKEDLLIHYSRLAYEMAGPYAPEAPDKWTFTAEHSEPKVW